MVMLRWVVLALAVLLLAAPVGLALAQQQQAAVTPRAWWPSFEEARNRGDIDAALRHFAPDATIRQRTTLMTGHDEIRRYLEGQTSRGRYPTVANRRADGTRVTWAERGVAVGPTTTSLPETLVEATVVEGKIKAIVYQPAARCPTHGAPAWTPAARFQPCSAWAPSCVLLLGSVLVASTRFGHPRGPALQPPGPPDAGPPRLEAPPGSRPESVESCPSLTPPGWRNGRRDGLKNRWGASPVRVRVPLPALFDSIVVAEAAWAHGHGLVGCLWRGGGELCERTRPARACGVALSQVGGDPLANSRRTTGVPGWCASRRGRGRVCVRMDCPVARNHVRRLRAVPARSWHRAPPGRALWSAHRTDTRAARARRTAAPAAWMVGARHGPDRTRSTPSHVDRSSPV